MISLILISLAAFLNASMDKCFNMFDSSIFNTSKFNQNFWNPSISWKNKWKNGDRNQGEKFFGSSTFLVWLTDGWHLLKMVFLLSIIISIILYKPLFSIVIDGLLLIILWFIIFELSLKFLTTKP